jgi:hypothetical protein
MIALSVRQPWAEAIVLGLKTIEVRTWVPFSIRLPRRIAIHAGKAVPRSWPPSVDAAMKRVGDRYGCIVGVATLIDVRRFADRTDFENAASQHLNPLAWWQPGLCAWQFGQAMRFEEPIPCRGMQGLFELADQEAQVVIAAIAGLRAPQERSNNED